MKYATIKDEKGEKRLGQSGVNAINWMVLLLHLTLTGGAGSADILLVAGLAGISRPLLGAFIEDRD
jgi:hypothetical protein